MSMEKLECDLGYTFRERKLLELALTHSSYGNEHPEMWQKSNERLEFLGDAVLELVSSDFLYHRFPDEPEGFLSRLRASLVCEPALAYCARELELGKLLRLGKGEAQTGGASRDSILSDAVESIIGAMYLDGGLDPARAFILNHILNDIDHKKLFYDSKTVLQERVQKDGQNPLSYHLIEESGPAHDRTYVTEVWLGEKVIGTGKGHSKKASEMQAAYQALLAMEKGTCI